MSSNKICFVFVVSHSSCSKDVLRAWPFPLTHRPAGVQGATSALGRSVWVGGGIVLNSNISETLEGSANPGLANNGLRFYFSFCSCQSE